MESSNLYAALSKAQAEMKPAKFNKVNPHFKSKYADLSSIMESCKEALCNNKLSILQIIDYENSEMILKTRIAHESGEFIEAKFFLRTEKNTLQGLGSAITYARRYSLAAILGIVADEDDDGNQATEEEELCITKPQEDYLVKMLLTLNEDDRAKVIKSLGFNNMGKVKKTNFEPTVKLIKKYLSNENSRS